MGTQLSKKDPSKATTERGRGKDTLNDAKRMHDTPFTPGVEIDDSVRVESDDSSGEESDDSMKAHFGSYSRERGIFGRRQRDLSPSTPRVERDDFLSREAEISRAEHGDNQHNSTTERNTTDNTPTNRIQQQRSPNTIGIYSDDFLSDEEFRFILDSTAMGDSIDNQPVVRSIRKGNSVKTSSPALSQSDELNREWTCKICMETAIQTVILPCRHAVSCIQCSKKLRNCPICRGGLDDVMPIFFG